MKKYTTPDVTVLLASRDEVMLDLINSGNSDDAIGGDIMEDMGA